MKKKLKIAIIGSRGYPYVYSGYETLVKEISERLVLNGHDVTVYCHRSLFIEKPRYVNGIELIYTPSIETKYLSQFVNSFFSFLHFCFSKSDVLLVVNSANGPFGIFTKIFKKKTCINVDGLEWLRPKWNGLGGAYFRFSSFLATKLFDVIITDSLEMKRIYLEKFKTESKVIAYGPTCQKYFEDSKFFKKLKLKKNSYYLIVGRLIPDNNALLIIKAFLKSKSNKKLVVVGDEPYNDKYSNEIKKINSKKIILTGYINSQHQLSELYKNCFIYIHGHEYGGTNPTMINALNLNCKILAIETPFTKEMLKNKFSLYFKKDINDIESTINQIEFGNIDYGNEKYNLPSKYNWNKIVKQYLEVLN